MLTTKEYRQMMYGLYSVKDAQHWNKQIGLEYWMQPALVSQGIGTFSDGLFVVTNNGWVNTGTIIGVANSGADFGSVADKGAGVTAFAIDTAADLLNSPAIFGDWGHMAAVAELAGMAGPTVTQSDLPTKLIYDSWSNFQVILTASDTSGHGFVEGGGAASVANDALAIIVSDGTSFRLRSGAATSSALMVADTNPHHFRIIIDYATQLCYAFIDNMSTPLGSIALETDLFPCSVGAGVLASTGANFINWGPTRVRYSWNGWGY